MSQDNSNGLKTPLGWAMANGDPSGDQTCQSSLNDAENGTTICGGCQGTFFAQATATRFVSRRRELYFACYFAGSMVGTETRSQVRAMSAGRLATRVTLSA
jgi:hypothetical protein